MADRSPLQIHETDPVAGRSALLRLLRIVLIAVIILVTFFYVLDIGEDPHQLGEWEINLVTGWPWVLLFALTLGFGVIAIDYLTPQKKISTLSGIFFGIVAGVVASIALSFLVDRLAEAYEIAGARIISSVKILIGIAATYLCVSIVLQTQDQFRLVIPYVEFARQIRGAKPLVLDTSAIIDARILDIGRTGLIQSPILIPSFVLAELHLLADSSDRLKRAKGRRGLDVVSKLQREPRLDVSIDETAVPGKNVDQMLVEFAAQTPAIVVTTDTALDRVAGIQGVPVINLNDVANTMRPSVLPGETLTVHLIKKGEQPSQGVGYLEDGTMVVAEDGVDRVGSTVQLTVTSSLQTNAGRLIFGRLDGRLDATTSDDDNGADARSGEPRQPHPDANASNHPDQSEASVEQDDGAESSTNAPKHRDPRRASARNPRR